MVTMREIKKMANFTLLKGATDELGLTHLPTFDAVEGLAWHDDQMTNIPADQPDAECPRLKKIFQQWNKLPEPIKVGIEALIESAIPR